MQNRFSQIRTAVEDWKRGAINAPEAIARVSRVVGVKLNDDPIDRLALIDPNDPRLGLRAIVARAADPDMPPSEKLTLECGHVLTQPKTPDKIVRVRCPQCIRELIDERGAP
jgi:hypothetical protein